MANKLDRTQILEDTNNSPIPDMIWCKYHWWRDQHQQYMKDSNGTIQFMNVIQWCLPCFDNRTNANTSFDWFTWQAQCMSNSLWYLQTKQLDITTNLEKPKRRFLCLIISIQSTLKDGEDESKKIDIEPHRVERLYIVRCDDDKDVARGYFR